MARLYNPHDERMNAYYVSAYNSAGAQVYECYEGDVVFSCCAKHLHESLQREGLVRIRIRRAWFWEHIHMRR